MSPPSDETELSLRRLVAPGTRLREAIELVLRQDTGGLIVLGTKAETEPFCSGGFGLDGAVFTPQRLAELAKMDGAIVVDSDAAYILKANVHLIPDSSIETAETGTRQRTAERMARQTGLAVISISEGRGSATVFTGETQYELRSPTALLARANQSVQSLERFRRRLDAAAEGLTRAEVADVVTSREVAVPLQRAALVVRLGAEVEEHAVELGREGELIRLQLRDLLEGVADLADVIYQDYAKRRTLAAGQLSRVEDLGVEDLYDLATVAAAFSLPTLEGHVRPRGLRALGRVPRLPDAVKISLLEHFGDFQKMLQASVAEFDQVEGVGRTRAQQLRQYFDQLLDIHPVWGFEDE